MVVVRSLRNSKGVKIAEKIAKKYKIIVLIRKKTIANLLKNHSRILKSERAENFEIRCRTPLGKFSKIV